MAQERTKKKQEKTKSIVVTLTPPGELFLQAVQTNSLSKVKQILQILKERDVFNSIINYQDKNGNTALHYAVLLKDSVNMVNFLLEKGVDPEIENLSEDTPLFLALYEKQKCADVIKAFIRYKIRIDHCNGTGEFPIHVAVRNKHLGAIELFLVYQLGTVLRENREGKTPLDLLNDNLIEEDKKFIKIKKLLLKATQKAKRRNSPPVLLNLTLPPFENETNSLPVQTSQELSVAKYRIDRIYSQRMLQTFAECTFHATNFSGMDLQGFNFSSLIKRTTTENEDGTKTTTEDKYPIDLSRSQFIGCNLIYALFKGAVLCGANFQGADLTWADFEDADLTDANFENAELYGANFNNTCLNYTNFTRANLKESKFNVTRGNVNCSVRLLHTEMERKTFEGTNFYQSAITDENRYIIASVIEDSKLSYRYFNLDYIEKFANIAALKLSPNNLYQPLFRQIAEKGIESLNTYQLKKIDSYFGQNDTVNGFIDSIKGLLKYFHRKRVYDTLIQRILKNHLPMDVVTNRILPQVGHYLPGKSVFN